jgi:hypothetical protein
MGSVIVVAKAAEGMGAVDNLDVSLQDDELLAEIGLATDLMIVASRFDRRLTRAEVDGILGIPVRLPTQRSG